jgi:hypothetical protein
VIQEILSVVTDQWRIVFGILFFIALGQGLVSAVFRRLYREQLTLAEYFSLGLAGWILPISLISILWLLLRFISNSAVSWLILFAGFLIPIFSLFRRKVYIASGRASAKIVSLLLAFVLISVLLRLAFVSRAILPSYFDSAAHYGMIKDIVQNGGVGLLASTPYYHAGYHLLAAFLASAFNAEIAKTMLILGQVILSLIPVSTFFLVKQLSSSNRAGIFAVILSAFGWYMPAHAANWGKYPALTSLAFLPFVLSLAYLYVRYRTAWPLQRRWLHSATLGLSILILTLLHSRVLIILAILFLSWGIAVWQRRLSLPIRTFLFAVILGVLVWQIFYIQKQAVLTPLLDPYLNKGIWITTPVLFLSIIALKEYSQVVFAGLLSVVLLFAALFVPVQIPGYGLLSLLDRPLVELLLYLPLTVLGGVGLAALEKPLAPLSSWKFLRPEYIHACLMGLIVIHAFAAYDFYPSDCCALVGQDDLAVLHWMRDHLPGDVQIGISVTELDVLPSEAFEAYNGADAGIWITPLIERGTIPLVNSSDFGQQSVRDVLCQSGVTHLYVGQLGQSFDPARLRERPEWYKLLFSEEKAGVYEVIGCG